FSDSADELTADGSGGFGGVIASAAAGQAYQYALLGTGGTVHKPDPRGRQLDAAGHSVIVDSGAWTWSSAFAAPPVEEMVIYELHVGTFSGALPSKFSDVAARLDYLAQLGVNLIELMPPA